MTATTSEWQSYFSAHVQDGIERLAETYPDRRSLYVDLLDLHATNEALLRALLDDPVAVLADGESVLRETIDVSGPVHVRIENNPQQRPVSAVTAHNVHDLVTVTGLVESIGPRRASAVVAAYECPVCEASTRLSQSGIDMASPTRCDNCGWEGEFTFHTSGSQFVDIQELTLRTLSEDVDGVAQTMPAYLDDDIVDSATEDDQYNVTGIVRVHRDGPTNEFTLYLDALSVREQREISKPEGTSDILDSHWGIDGES